MKMKLAIITEEKKSDSDLMLHKRAKDYFEKVLLIPQNRLFVSLNKEFKAVFKTINVLESDALLIRLPKTKYTFSYELLKNYKGYSPTQAFSHLFTSDRFMMMNLLSKEKLPIPNSCIIDSSKPMIKALSELKFPITLKVPVKERGIMFANNLNEAKTMIDTLTTLKQPIYIEEHYEGDIVEAFVIGSEVVTSVKRKVLTTEDMLYGRGKMERYKIPKELEEIIIAASSAIRANFARVDVIEEPARIVGIDLSPPIVQASEKTGVDIGDLLLSYMKQSVAVEKKAGFSLLVKFIDHVRSTLFSFGQSE